MKKAVLVSLAVLFLMCSFTTVAVAGFEPSPFQPAVTIENISDQLDTESHFYGLPLKDVEIEFYYMGADGSMALWGSYLIESIGAGEKYIFESTDWNPSETLDDIPTGATIFAKGTGKAGTDPMILFPEGTTETSGLPNPELFVELKGYDPSGGVSDMLPFFAFEISDVTAPIPGVMVGVVEVAFEETSPPAPTEVVVPSEQAPTIQAAIDLVADGGTVEIGRGVFSENIVITDKVVNIQGNRAFGFRRTEIIGADADLPVITFGPGGGGSVAKMTLRGGKSGIEGIVEDGDDITKVDIKNTRILYSVQGISGSFFRFTLTKSIIRGMESNGISIDKISALELLDTLIWDCDVGLVMNNTSSFLEPGNIVIDGCSFWVHHNGGIAVIGDYNDVYINNCHVGVCLGAGILISYGGYVEITNTTVNLIGWGSIPPVDETACGFLFRDTDFVRVDNCTITNCYMAGIFSSVSGGLYTNTLMSGDVWGLGLVGPLLPYFDPAWNNNTIINGLGWGEPVTPDFDPNKDLSGSCFYDSNCGTGTCVDNECYWD